MLTVTSDSYIVLFYVKSSGVYILCPQFPQHYAAISESNQPAELISQFSTIEYQLQVQYSPPASLSLDWSNPLTETLYHALYVGIYIPPVIYVITFDLY